VEKLRIIVGGFIGLYPTGGVTWDYIQYPLGLHLLGHDVYYIEDTLQYSRFQTEGKKWNDASYSVKYLKDTMEKFGLTDRWAYRDIGSGNCFGIPLDSLKEICKTADVFINISASTFLRDEYLAIPIRVLIDSDPMFTQIEYYHEKFINENTDRYKMKFVVENHTHLFTFGENINKEGCKIPGFSFNWKPTRQPICLDNWDKIISTEKTNSFSTVMNWSVRKDMIFCNENWGQKDIEFEKIITLPELVPQVNFEILITGITEEKKAMIESHGWKVSNPLQKITTADSYQEFIASSSGEFSVAKETYVKSNSGWFSCRSACYLAAGKPVVTQETGWSNYIPSGLGLFAFEDLQTGTEALFEITSDMERHSKAAKDIAFEYFDSNKVLNSLINRF